MPNQELRCQRLTSADPRRSFLLGPIDARFTTGITAIIGTAASGASTLLRLLAGRARPDCGVVEFNGDPAAAAHVTSYVARGTGFVEGLECAQHLARVARERRVPRGDRARSVADAIEHSGLAGCASMAVRELGTEHLTRLAIAEALLTRPQVLAIDEPLLGLARSGRSAIRALLSDLAGERIVIVATATPGHVSSLATQAMVLHAGRVAFHGPTVALAAQAPLQSTVCCGECLASSQLTHAMTRLTAPSWVLEPPKDLAGLVP